MVRYDGRKLWAKFGDLGNISYCWRVLEKILDFGFGDGNGDCESKTHDRGIKTIPLESA